MRLVDLTGKPFGKLTVIGRDTSKKKTYWLCKCECGNIVSVRSDHLLNGETRSCGCMVREVNSAIHSIDLTGQTFGRLKVLRFSGRIHKCGERIWICQCSCPDHTIVEVTTNNLTRGNTTSCGCYQRERTSEAHLKWKTPDEQRLMITYNSMVQRCTNPNHAEFKYWGGRGITICPEWADSTNGRRAFVDWALNNGYASNLSIDRIDVNGPYAPWNCRWATDEQQANNTRSNVVIEIDGISKTLSEWSRATGIVYDRLKYLKNVDPSKAVSAIKSHCPELFRKEMMCND